MRLSFDSLPTVVSRSVSLHRFHRVHWRCCVCVVAALSSMTGCRSSLPRMGMFGFRSEPSADALAGVGPTATYPVSPSAGVSPEAIASAAAGTAAPSGLKPQTASLASVSPGAIPPPSATAGLTTPGGVAQIPNQAAAAANGFYGNRTLSGSLTASPASYGNVAGQGYTYGQNPAASTATSPVNSPGGGINAIAAGYIPPARPPARPPVSSESVPAYAQTTDAVPAITPPATYAASIGYPLPGSPTPQASAPSAVTSTSPGFTMPPVASTTEAAKPVSSAGGFTIPPGVIAAPTAAVSSTATAAPPSGPAAYQASIPAAPSAPSAQSTGYAPGSTAGAVGYPASGGYPATGSSESFYR